MNKLIEIHNYDENETGTYIIWYTNEKKEKCTMRMSHNDICSILTRDQEEQLFFAEKSRYKFKIKSDYDFKTKILNHKQ